MENKNIQMEMHKLSLRNEKVFRDTRFYNSIAEFNGNYFVNEDGKLRDLNDSEFLRFKEQFEYIEYNSSTPKGWVDPDVQIVGTSLEGVINNYK